jgi:hypothetical protein
MEQKRHVVLGEAFGQEVEKAACRVLYKLGPLPHSTVVYRELLRAISLKPIAAALGHLSTFLCFPSYLSSLTERCPSRFHALASPAAFSSMLHLA